MDEQEQKLKLSDVTVNDVTTLLKSREAHRLAISAGVGMATGPVGFLLTWFGLKTVGPMVQKDIETFRKLKADLKANMPKAPPAIALTPRQQNTSARVILGSLVLLVVLIVLCAVQAALVGG
jgi:hypothetical protein